MSKRARPLEDKIMIVKALENGTSSISELESIYNVDRSVIRDCVYNYEKYGIKRLKESASWKGYSKELKLNSVKDYLSGEYPLRDVIRKYEISSSSVLRQWIKKYNGHGELKDTGKRRSSSITIGRKTTWKERIENELKLFKMPLRTVRITEKLLKSIVCLINRYIDGFENMRLVDGMP